MAAKASPVVPSLNEFVAARTKAGAPSAWGRIWDQLSPQQQADLHLACVSRDISAQVIATVVAKWGHQIASTTARNWKREHAGCDGDTCRVT